MWLLDMNVQPFLFNFRKSSGKKLFECFYLSIFNYTAHLYLTALINMPSFVSKVYGLLNEWLWGERGVKAWCNEQMLSVVCH